MKTDREKEKLPQLNFYWMRSMTLCLPHTNKKNTKFSITTIKTECKVSITCNIMPEAPIREDVRVQSFMVKEVRIRGWYRNL